MHQRWIEIDAEGGRTFQAYLSEPAQGSGPGIIVCHGQGAVDAAMRDLADRFAEEGYVVLVPALDRIAAYWLEPTVAALRAMSSCKGKVGVLGSAGGTELALRIAASGLVDCAACYCEGDLERAIALSAKLEVPMVLHCARLQTGTRDHEHAPRREPTAGQLAFELHVYPDVGEGFYRTGSPEFHGPAAGMAYSRTLALFRRVMGPYYDLSALWEVHRACEFVARDAEATMRTMVAQPYVNHIPTMTGGYGYADLHRFYRDYFVSKLPKDIKNIPISRTVGADRVVNEGVLCFTHDTEIAWMLPGVQPTGRYVEVALVGIITFRGDKLVHEHIYWDQASVLVQIGLLDPRGLPVAGAETARKVLDPSLPSNALIADWSESR